MKRGLVFLVFFLCMLVALGGSALAWQGRMAGMGDPYGLLEDESDFLVHPSLIAEGQGVNFFGHFGFQYRDVSDWKYDFKLNPSSIRILGNPIPGLPALGLNGGYSGSGDEQYYDAMAGVAFPLWCGRMGIFFNYKGKQGDYDGSGLFAGAVNGLGSASIGTGYNMDSSLDSFAGRFVYGMPLGSSLKLGAELEVAYHKDENNTSQRLANILVNETSYKSLLDFTDHNGFLGTLSPFMFPYDSEYWEFTPKVGLTGMSGPVKWGVTVRGGAIFSGDNKWSSGQSLTFDPSQPPFNAGGVPLFDASHTFGMKGDVSGWKVGGDFWLRYALSPCMNLPFLLRVDYREISRDGSGAGLVFAGFRGEAALIDDFALDWKYDHQENLFEVETGAGLEYVPNKATRVAGGLYYKYINSERKLGITPSLFIDNLGSELIPSMTVGLPSAFSPAPEITEHQLIFRLAAEREINPCFVLRGGVKAFYGWVDENFNLATSLTPTGLSILTSRNSLSGNHWGILGGIGATAKFAKFALEPFVQGGYEVYEPSGTGTLSLLQGVADASFDVNKERRDAFIGAGLSIRF